MNEIFNKISELIKQDFFCQQKAEKLILQDSSSNPVEIKKKGRIACLEIDKEDSKNFPLFESKIKGLCSIADRIIFYSKDDVLFVFIIELKTKSTTGAMWQVNASFELAKYICCTIRRMINYKEINFQYRGLVFAERSIKGTSKPKNLEYQIHPHSQLKFKSLQSGSVISLDTLTF